MLLEEAHQALIAGSHPLVGSGSKTAGNKGQLIAFNTIPDYPRVEVVAVCLKGHPKLKALSAQVSTNKQTGFMLVDASDAEPIGLAKGLFADVEPVRSRYLLDRYGGTLTEGLCTTSTTTFGGRLCTREQFCRHEDGARADHQSLRCQARVSIL